MKEEWPQHNHSNTTLPPAVLFFVSARGSCEHSNIPGNAIAMLQLRDAAIDATNALVCTCAHLRPFAALGEKLDVSVDVDSCAVGNKSLTILLLRDAAVCYVMQLLCTCAHLRPFVALGEKLDVSVDVDCWAVGFVLLPLP